MFDGPVENASLRVLSLGAGVQSSVMALMAAHGEIAPMPDAAIFAATQWAPESGYEHLDWLETQLPFPVYKVSEGNLREDVLSTTLSDKTNASIPFFMTPDSGMLWRQCTKNYKVIPITRKIKELLGLEKYQRVAKNTLVERWMGISLDEVIRAKDSPDKWAVNRYPLIEKRLSRFHCQTWFEKYYPGRKLNKSACIGCPYHSNFSWRAKKLNDPISWNDAVDFDYRLRSGPRKACGGQEKAYLHRSLIPLDQVDLSTEQDKGQMDMFGEECEGMCGV